MAIPNIGDPNTWQGGYEDYTGVSSSRANNAANLQIARETNSQNLDIFREGNVFSAQQAALDRSFQSGEARTNRNFQADQVASNRQFQERMSSTSHQRAAADLEKAGLNRILAVTQGGSGGASGSTASGSQASGSRATSGATKMERAVMEDVKTGRNLATALQIVKARADVKKTEAETERVKVETDKGEGGLPAKVFGTEVVNKVKDQVKEITSSTAKHLKDSNEKQKRDYKQGGVSGWWKGKKKRMGWDK